MGDTHQIKEEVWEERREKYRVEQEVIKEEKAKVAAIAEEEKAKKAEIAEKKKAKKAKMKKALEEDEEARKEAETEV